MASNNTLSAQNLKALGTKRLAELLMEIAEGDAAVKRQLRFELATKTAPHTIAAELRKRLAQIERAPSFVDWHGVKGLAADLEVQRSAIVDRLAKIDAGEALDLMWRFIELAEPVLGRCDDSSGLIGSVFRDACRDLGPLVERARPDPCALADRVFTALKANNYGQFGDLIKTLAPALGGEGLGRLKAQIIALAKLPVQTPQKRKVVGWGSGGRIYEDDIEAYRRKAIVRLALLAIADAQGDVDGFMAQYDEKTRKVPKIAAEIAGRLLAVGRAQEALVTIEAAEQRHGGWPDFAWEDARIEVFDALGRGDDAQAARWSCFERTLSTPHLRAYLERLADFDDVEAELRALDHAECFPSLLQALAFLVSWPALDRAARLVTSRAAELSGDHYEILAPAADKLAGEHPLAATLVLRAMIDFALGKARSSRYAHAARHLMECASLAASISDYGAVETHEAYAARLKSEHARKSAFWSLMS